MVTRLEALLADSLTVTGSTGQSRLSPAVAELRQHRLALSKLLIDLALPAETIAETIAELAPSVASSKASKAAKVRWNRQKRWRRRDGRQVAPAPAADSGSRPRSLMA